MELRIGELSQQTGCKVVTIRYYEKEGLLPEPSRDASNYRRYDESHVERLHFIRHCRSLDMTLEETRFLLDLKADAHQSCDEVETLLDTHLLKIEHRVRALLSLKEQLLKLRTSCSGEQEIASCGILRELSTRAETQQA